MNYFRLFFITFLICSSAVFYFCIIKAIYQALIYRKQGVFEKHYCKYCEEHFIAAGEENYKYCPYCGIELESYNECNN